MEGMPFKTLDLAFFLRLVKRYWIFLAICSVVGAVTGFCLARWVIAPTYEATALIFTWSDVENMGDNSAEIESMLQNENLDPAAAAKLRQSLLDARVKNYQQLNYQISIGNKMMPDLEALLNSRSMAIQINKALQEEFGQGFAERYQLVAKPVKDTRFVLASVRCKNKDKAPRIINTAMKIFTREARELLGINKTRVIDEALEAYKVSPNTFRMTGIGLVIGLLISGGIAFLIMYFDKSIHDLKELEGMVGLPVLGVLPEVAAGTGNDGELWRQENKSVYGEAIRALRVNVEYLLPEEGRAKVFLITSVGKGDGKSSIISSLAVAIARLEKRVLLVDMDLRRPRQHRIFRLPNQAGLVDMLVTQKQFDELVHRNVKVPGLDVLTRGPSTLTPSDLLASPRLEKFLQEQAQNYDYIFLDAPPVMGLADPLILGKLADTTIFACDFKSANIDKIRAVTERLRQAEIKLAGLVLNRFSLEARSDYYYYYQQYYGYHYSYSYAYSAYDESEEDPDQWDDDSEGSLEDSQKKPVQRMVGLEKKPLDKPSVNPPSGDNK